MKTGMDRVHEIVAAIDHVMGDELKLEVPEKYYLLRDGQFVLLLGVMDVQNLRGSIHKYTRDELLHQMSTAVGGLPVVLSNHSGLRYAVSLMGQPKLPRKVLMPDTPAELDVIRFGVSLRGAVDIHAKKIVNLIIGGSQDSGKSTLLRSLAHTNRLHGAKLYLADPMTHTFNPDVWDGIAAMPVASKRLDVIRLIEALQAEMESRSVAFRQVADGGVSPDDLDAYNEIAETRLPRLWFIGDEMNTYLSDRVVQGRMAELARGGRKWGVHVALAAHTWRDADIPRGLSALFPSRLCLRVADDTSGRVTLNDARRGREPLKFRLQGRALLLANGMYQKVQLYYVSPEQQRAWLTSGEPVPTAPLPANEMMLVERSLGEAGGRMSIPLLKLWGADEWMARQLLERYELRGWLEKDSAQKNARYITPKLKGLLSNAQTAQTGSSTHIQAQTGLKLSQTLDLGFGGASA